MKVVLVVEAKVRVLVAPAVREVKDRNVPSPETVTGADLM